MGLAIYDKNRLAIQSFTNKIVTSHNGTLGEAVDVLLYLRNDDPNVYYQGIALQVTDNTGDDDTLGPEGTGWGVKLSGRPRRPTPAEWGLIGFASPIHSGTFGDIGTTSAADTTTYYASWVRVSVPGNIVSMIKENISLIINAEERLVGT